MESRPETLSTKETMKQVSRELQGVSLAVINHIVLPAAVILMVGAFLFFLLDVRSVYFSESLTVRRVAFFFGTATVLIARYGRMYFARGRQLLYTSLLACVTSLVMLQFSRGISDLLVNLLVLAAVWWLATQITDCLDMGDEVEEEKRHVYGVERLHREAVHHKLKLQPGRKTGQKDHAEKTANPSSAVARLALIALLAFALGEPVILAGRPEAGARAIAAVIVFLLSTGVVMSAGSAIHLSRRVKRSGGNLTQGMVPARILAAFLILSVVLSVSLAVPGISFRGSGETTPQIEKMDPSDEGRGDRKRRGRGAGSAQTGLFDLIASLGRLLLIPMVLLAAGLIVYSLVKLWPFLKERGYGITRILGALLERWRARFRKHEAGDGSGGKTDRKELLRAIEDIKGLAPREAILASYDCLRKHFVLFGYERPEDNTPHEILRSLPRRFDHLKEQVASLTDLYVAAAYSSRPSTSEQSRKALESLLEIKSQLEAYAKDSISR
jgi:hypothetical protein